MLILIGDDFVMVWCGQACGNNGNEAYDEGNMKGITYKVIF